MTNLGLAYYKRYWDCLEGNNKLGYNYSIEEIEERLLESQDILEYDNDLKELGMKQSFCLKTTYPGLLIGTGYLHEVPNQDNASKLGFYFDYTLGIPIIPGSSIKGVLRSLFPNGTIVDDAKEKLINYFFKEKLRMEDALTSEELEILKNNIFEGLNVNREEMPISQRDIFFDALIISNNGKTKQQIIGTDYITPHKDPLKEPTPLKMLKIMPNVVFEFKFCLKDIVINNKIISATMKLELFKELLLFNGIGAKTNVGYGNLDTIHSRLQSRVTEVSKKVKKIERKKTPQKEEKEENAFGEFFKNNSF